MSPLLGRILRFAVVGGLGFLTDAVVLSVLLRLTPLGPFSARLFSIAAAMTVTWLLNRAITFGPSRSGMATEGARYAAVAVSVSAANYLIYSGLLLAVPGMPPLAALAAASIAAMVLSYLGYSRLVFGR